MHVLVRCLAAWSPPRRLQCSARRWVVLLGLPLVLLTSSAMAAPVTLAWDASVSMVDGYWLYYGLASGTYTARIDVGPVTTYTLTGLTSGQTYYFAVTAYDRTDGRESGPSNEVSTTLPPRGGPPPITTAPWTFCATNHQFCAFTGTKLVRYGAGNTFAFRTATNGISCSKAVFGDPLVGVVKHCDYTETTAATWTFCATNHQFCAFTGTKLVRYGAGNTFAFRTATNGISCSKAVFGDPLVGVVKHCDYR